MFCRAILIWLAVASMLVIASVTEHVHDLPSINCRSDVNMREYYRQNKDAHNEMQLFEIQTRQFINTKRTSKSYVIPVVFHVYGTNFAGQTVNDATIIRALERLNDDFHGLNADYHTVHSAFQANRSTFDVTFKLARKDPNGNPTTGIIYYPARGGYGSTAFNGDIQREAWNNYKYCNVYVQLDLYNDGQLTNSGVAWYPATDMSNANLARIVYNGRYLYGNTDNEFASVLTHEFGHWLNLIHTFEEGCSTASENRCEHTGDRVCDTPQTVGNQGCGAMANCVGKLVNSENYMDYSGAYGCYKMFTAGQAARMEAAMNHPARITLWQHANLVATGLAADLQNVAADCPLDATTINFDDISNTYSYTAIPNVYAQLRWENAMIVSSAAYPNTGYSSALKSGKYVAYNEQGNPMTISAINNKHFSLHSFNVAAAWNEGLTVTFRGYRNGYEIHSSTYVLSTKPATLITLNWDNLDMFRVQVTPAANVAIDNLCIKY